MAGVHDFLRSTRNEKPDCWGDPDEHDPNDTICRGCDWFASCKTQSTIKRPRSIKVNQSSPYKKRSYGTTEVIDDVEFERLPDTEEKAAPRLAKNILGGVLRAFGLEIYQFFKRFRIP